MAQRSRGTRERLTKVNTLLFDLDGTLLGNDMDVFLRYYLGAVAMVAAATVPQDRFIKQLLASTEAMVRNSDPTVTNAEAFAGSFYSALGLDRRTAEPLFAEFYEREFPKLRVHTQAKPAARALLDLATRNRYGLVLATNPVFPRVAIDERMRWADIDRYPWLLITDYETMHHCKPHVAYYQEILDKTGRRAEECLMVGNDVEEDLVAGRLGMVTFLDRTQIIQRGGGPSGADVEGTLEDLCDLLASLPGQARRLPASRCALPAGHGSP